VGRNDPCKSVLILQDCKVMNTNGFLVSPTFAKWIIGTVFAIGVWVATIQADIGGRAEKTEVVRITQILISIENKLEDLKEDNKEARKERQELSKDVAVLMDKDE